MREILFRGKRVDNGEWVHGRGYYVWGNINYILDEKTPTLYADDVFWIAVDPKTVGQYTGIKDINGKKIFEGDIILYSWLSGEKTLCFIAYDIEYANFFNVLIATECKNFSIGAHFSNGEVVGHIYDKPELLALHEKSAETSEK